MIGRSMRTREQVSGDDVVGFFFAYRQMRQGKAQMGGGWRGRRRSGGKRIISVHRKPPIQRIQKRKSSRRLSCHFSHSGRVSCIIRYQNWVSSGLCMARCHCQLPIRRSPVCRFKSLWSSESIRKVVPSKIRKKLTSDSSRLPERGRGQQQQQCSKYKRY